MSAVKIAGLLDKDSPAVRDWQGTAESIKKAIIANLWKNDWHRFIRSIRVKKNPWG